MNRQQRRAAEKAAASGQVTDSAAQAKLLEAFNLQSRGRFAEAEALCRQVVAAHPRYAQAHGLLGVIAIQTNQLDQAADAIRKAIQLDPSDADSHFNLGSVLHKQGRLAEAVERYRKAVERNPAQPKFHNNLGAALKDLGQAAAAVQAHRKAIALKPDFADAHSNLGNAYRALGDHAAALEAYQQAVTLQPDFADAVHNVGVALGDLKRFEESLPPLRRALELKPDFAEAHNTLGAALNELERPEESEQHYIKALAIRPGFGEAHNNLGTLLNRLGRRDEAVSRFRSALALKSGFPEARVNLGQVMLSRGNLAVGWREYEARLDTAKALLTRRTFRQPRWTGDPAPGKTLLIHAEQGFGDSLQFARYATIAAERGLKVVLEVPRPLVRLLATVPGVERVVSEGDPLPPFDLQIPMMSLPTALDLPMLTASEPYIRPDPAAVEHWRAKLDALAPKRRRVGLVWAGNPGLKADARRSIALERLAPLLAIPGIAFVNLQKDIQAPADLGLIEVMGEVGDFADTAALVENLDLVIAVDTAVAHLAGALGKPVWLLNRFDTCWRWLLEGSSSAWYPSLTIYRQPEPHDWDTVLTAVERDLRGLAATTAATASD